MLRTISNIYGIPFAVVVLKHFDGSLFPEIERLREIRSQKFHMAETDRHRGVHHGLRLSPGEGL